MLKLFFLSFRNYYFKSSYYNKKLITFIPDRIIYNPSTHLSASLTTISNEFYKISNTSPKLLWEINYKDKLNFENLHNFLWLTRLDRKNSKKITKNIIESWINNFFNYETYSWQMEITAKRIIAWISNTDITLENSEKLYKEKFLLSLVKQSNFLVKNLKNMFNDSNKIVCCAAIILTGMIFKENNLNFKIGIKELEKIVKNYFDDDGFPKSRSAEEVFTSLKYFILIREWLKEAFKPVPDFLNEIINKTGACYSILSCSNKQFPLFNGSTEINHKDYDIFLKALKYKFASEKNEVGNLFKIKKKKFEFFIDLGNPPANKFAKFYQAGCLSFELISNKQKVICNSGYGKYFSSKLISLSRSTAAHSTLYINNSSSCIFQKNELINKIYGNSLLEQSKIIDKNYTENKDYYSLNCSHNGYEKRFGYIHTRSIRIPKKEDKVIGQDKLKKTKKYDNSILFSIRFHIYPNTKIVKTKGRNSVLISLSNGEGWLLRSDTNNFEIEKSIFLGNKRKILNNESIFISGSTDKESISIDWVIERVN